MDKFDVITSKAINANDVLVDLNSATIEIPKVRALGPNYLEKDDYFVVDKNALFEDIAMRRTEKDDNGEEKIKTQVYYLIVKLVKADGTPRNIAKRLYLNSFCKTVYGWAKDDEGNIKRSDKYITTTGNVADLVQQKGDWKQILEALDGKTIHVADIHDIVTREFNADKNAPIKLKTGHTFDLHCNDI